MELAILILLIAAVVLLLILLLRPNKNDGSLNALNTLGGALQENQRLAAEKQAQQLEGLKRETTSLLAGQTELVRELKEGLTGQIDRMDRELTEDQKQLNESVGERMGQLQKGLNAQLDQLRENSADGNMALQRSVSDLLGQMAQRLEALEKSNEEKLEAMRASLTQGVTALREENTRKLDEIRGTVDEKLQTTLEKRITESFRTVSQQLEQVYKGLGEMQTLASDVGGLKKVLSGVKTRGILGEVQLGAILEEILSPEQYETNVATVPGSRNQVEFAVRLPGENGNTVYLPIDSKFPGERYAQLLEARDSGDKDAVDAALRELWNVLKSEAKDIRDKYVSVPATTNFGIMFLPFEGLYAEVVNGGLLEILQRDYHINVAGPSTMAALLNSLQMGFRTLAIQKRSSEVWEVLGAVKTEFDKFEGVMVNMQKHLNQTSQDLETLMTTRSRAISRRLRSVQELDGDRTAALLGLPESMTEE